jgi:hypothetical protein
MVTRGALRLLLIASSGRYQTLQARIVSYPLLIPPPRSLTESDWRYGPAWDDDDNIPPLVCDVELSPGERYAQNIIRPYDGCLTAYNDPVSRRTLSEKAQGAYVEVEIDLYRFPFEIESRYLQK